MAITTINVGVGGTFNISGTGNGGVTLGGITAGAPNASTAASGVTMTAASVGQISILGSAQADTLRGSGVADRSAVMAVTTLLRLVPVATFRPAARVSIHLPAPS